MATIREIAEALSLSKATVSRAISGKGRISQETRDRVNRYISEVGYQPNAIAQSLVNSKAHSIGLVIPKDVNASLSFFFYECVLGVCEVCEAFGYSVIVVTAERDEYAGFEHLIRNRKIDGLILTRMYQNDRAAEMIEQSKIPFLLIGEAGEQPVTEVCNDSEAASRSLTDYMIDTGSQRLLFMGGDSTHIVMRNRAKGFTNGIKMSPKSQSMVLQDLKTELDLEMKLPRVLEQFRPDAIITADDVICEWALTRLQAQNIRIPNDIRIASCFNSNALARYVPSITAIDTQPHLLARTAALTMMDMLTTKAAPPRTLVPYFINLRESTMRG